MREEYTVKSLCRAFGVSESGFYAYLSRPQKGPSDRDKEDCQMIKKLYMRSGGTIGIKAISGTLKSQFNHVINHKRVKRLMDEMNLKSVIRKKKYVRTSRFNDPKHVYPNLLQRNFDALLPNTKWVADITEFSYYNVKFYGCAIVDLFDR
nr:IS3 family transposase [Jeotgalibacillus malaysiensis]